MEIANAKASGVISKPSILEHVHKRKIARHVTTRSLFLQMSQPKVDFANDGLNMQTTVLCYTQPLNSGLFIAFKYFFENTPFFPGLYKFYLPINDFVILG